MKEVEDESKEFIRICGNTIIILFSIIMESFLLGKYPMTGLGRIFSMPLTILICFGLMLIANLITKNLRNTYAVIAIYILMIILTVTVCIGLWIQDGGPTTWEQIFEGKKRENFN